MKKEVLTLALGIALLPPLWAVLAPYIGITTGSVALVCAAVYVANGNRVKDGLRISAGFLMGDLWAYLVMLITDALDWNADLELFVTLFAMGALAVMIACALPKAIFLPSWLCGWAVGLTVMAPGGFENVGSLPLQIAVAMLVGVWYVGFGVDAFQKLLLAKNHKVNEEAKN